MSESMAQDLIDRRFIPLAQLCVFKQTRQDDDHQIQNMRDSGISEDDIALFLLGKEDLIVG